MAFAGVRLRRPECKPIAYAALTFVAAKLIFEDLRHGHFEFIAASIFLFAISLMIVPRLASTGQKI
jgi:predicted tellurium resistance membrane protein TerC